MTDSVCENLLDLQQISDNVRATVPYERYKRDKEEGWVFFSQKYPNFLFISFVPLICKEMSERFIGKEMSVICCRSKRFSRTELVTDFRNEVV